MKKCIATLFCCLSVMTTAFAQLEEPELTPVEKLEQKTQTLEDAVKKLQKFKVSGYVQAQYLWGEQDASLKSGTANENPEESFNRFGVRRGRIKFVYEEGLVSATFQPDFTEKGIAFKDVFLAVKDPWLGTSVLKAGIFDRPFGDEISFSSSRRESPERSTIFQTLFPEERDLGASLTLQADKTSPWNILKLEAGLFAGNGIKQETDSRLDFIGHLSAAKIVGSDLKIGGGVSYYNGGLFQGTDKVYSIDGKEFVLNDDAANKGRFAKREYMGLDAQLSFAGAFGMTQLRGEYLFGEQPAAKGNSKSPNASALPAIDTYNRSFSGGYVVFVQDIAQLPFSAVLKYDWYDPNTKLSGDEAKTEGDIAVNTFGLGLLWRASANVKLTAFYELNKNETSQAIDKYKNDRKDNVLTLRLQYKF
ncbi:hypothetical protein [Viscerimonas tarda]